jgi:hypothetical protein
MKEYLILRLETKKSKRAEKALFFYLQKKDILYLEIITKLKGENENDKRNKENR